MMTNEILHIGDRNKVQAVSYLSSRLAWLRLTKITHIEVIPGPNVPIDELVEEIRTSEKFNHSVESAEITSATIYIVLK